MKDDSKHYEAIIIHAVKIYTSVGDGDVQFQQSFRGCNFASYSSSSSSSIRYCTF